ncbi:divalent-cation tolerance protein CutA [Kibdelosporangium aridum]|uniref:Divalent-cation tolerance protein CutA n=1 Tax=Kibdelosporangium aridum TaxID=2030 RepID=A0A428ZTS7_KIBAR|nr:divalent cation tolerance protein CutA [Kibdelosporangium aridum]RSM91470.1 divalent-cation tolerance protein CutA [Kibdelosporangium aridum]
MDYGHVVVTFTTDSKQLACTMATEVSGIESTCCAHIEGPIRRVHRWHGHKHASEQWRVEIEATHDGADALVEHITSHHGHEVHDLVVTDPTRHLVDETADTR